MRIVTGLTIFAAPLALADCNNSGKSDNAETVPMKQIQAQGRTEHSAQMPRMGVGEAGRVASGIGTITAINARDRTIMIDHQAIPEVGWPAMRMSFAANKALGQELEVGDAVRFTFQMTGRGSATLTAIERQ